MARLRAPSIVSVALGAALSGCGSPSDGASATIPADAAAMATVPDAGVIPLDTAGTTADTAGGDPTESEAGAADPASPFVGTWQWNEADRMLSCPTIGINQTTMLDGGSFMVTRDGDTAVVLTLGGCALKMELGTGGVAQLVPGQDCPPATIGNGAVETDRYQNGTFSRGVAFTTVALSGTATVRTASGEAAPCTFTTLGVVLKK
jgi:hypothetical protein